MYLKLINIIAALLLTLSASAFDLHGSVTDEKGDPISFVSVFVKSEPSIGTVTDDDGLFHLELDDKYSDDIIIFSFAGYETATIDLSEINDRQSPLKVRLKDDIIYLDEVTVYANPQRISNRKQVKNILQRVREQMIKDFPFEDRDYNVLSNYYVFDSNKIILSEEAFGKLSEIPLKNKFGMDSLVFDIESRKSHFDEKTRHSIVSLGDSILSNEQKTVFKKEKEKSRSMVHEMVWGYHPITFFDMLEDKPKYWEKAELDDGNTLLIYTRDKNVFGILKYEIKVSYVLDSYTYSISSVKETITAEANIPFGYKLDETELKILNLFTHGYPIDKFRIKHIYGSFEKLSRYGKAENRLLATDKSIVAKTQIQNRKGVGIELHDKSDIKVLEP